jgi:hypothetical protein
VILEVTQISKIIHSHEKLSLFSSDTCPYCLRNVNREKGHCVCGGEVSEEQYERFFYNSEEYSDILKSKQKSIETVDLAISSCKEQIEIVAQVLETINTQLVGYQERISNWVKEYDFSENSQELKQIDDIILKVRIELSVLTQKIAIEEKRNKMQENYESINKQYEILKANVRALEAQANLDIRTKIDEFNVIYNNLMTNTLKTCRSASIGYDDYMPIIDGGVYKEASASVTIRMMYFFTLLKLSLENSEVKYPKLLLIDTPETAGVDSENLITALSQISTFPTAKNDEYQIILTTGIGKYPSAFKDNVLIKLSDENKLLIPIENTGK